MNVLLIGAGTMGSIHANAYTGIDGVQLAGIVDNCSSRGKRLAEQCRTRYFSTLEEASASLPAIDVIDICVPTFLHKAYVMKAADLNCHVICEKPLALTTADAEQMIDYCKQRGVRLFVGQVLRFFKEYRKAKEIVEAGRIGRLGMARTHRTGPFPQASMDWYADYSKSGGVLLDLMIHDFDFLRWCFGEVERVFAKGTHGRLLQQSDYALVTLRFKNGVIAHAEGSWSHPSFSMGFELAGSKGIVDYDSRESASVQYANRESASTSAGVAVPSSPLVKSPYQTEIEHFLQCLKQDLQPAVTAEEALKAVEISNAATASMKSGKPVIIGGESS